MAYLSEGRSEISMLGIRLVAQLVPVYLECAAMSKSESSVCELAVDADHTDSSQVTNDSQRTNCSTERVPGLPNSNVGWSAKCSTARYLLFASSLAMFFVSLTQDCFLIDRAEDPRALALGIGLLLFGWFSVSTTMVAWLANPALILAWVVMRRNDDRVGATCFSLAAFGLSASFLVHDEVVGNSAGHLSVITSYGPGFWLWLGSTIAALTCSIVSFGCETTTGKKATQVPSHS